MSLGLRNEGGKFLEVILNYEKEQLFYIWSKKN